LQKQHNSCFARMKRHLIIGVRKTHRYTPNHKTSDFIVPFTSSGCSAMCMYCYLVCNYNKCSYMRLFVNREAMMDRLIKNSQKSDKELVFEIGSNSDLILENTITNNLPYVIERFSTIERGYLTFPTKFDMVNPLLPLNHRGRIKIRMSVNPEEIIQKIEFKTSRLDARIDAINKLCEAGYKVGLLIAPVVLTENWKQLYSGLIDKLSAQLSSCTKKQLFIEIIFMTYSYVHKAINNDAFPNAIELYDKQIMTGRGRGKYCYRESVRHEGEEFLRAEIAGKLPEAKVVYVV
ncbi:MAG: spore photoproduct lyase, partial [Clostridiales bacterium]|nr:spore photoproduct lyase [Clostridiales bacterium]